MINRVTPKPLELVFKKISLSLMYCFAQLSTNQSVIHG